MIFHAALRTLACKATAKMSTSEALAGPDTAEEPLPCSTNIELYDGKTEIIKFVQTLKRQSTPRRLQPNVIMVDGWSNFVAGVLKQLDSRYWSVIVVVELGKESSRGSGVFTGDKNLENIKKAEIVHGLEVVVLKLWTSAKNFGENVILFLTQLLIETAVVDMHVWAISHDCAFASAQLVVSLMEPEYMQFDWCNTNDEKEKTRLENFVNCRKSDANPSKCNAMPWLTNYAHSYPYRPPEFIGSIIIIVYRQYVDDLWSHLVTMSLGRRPLFLETTTAFSSRPRTAINRPTTDADTSPTHCIRILTLSQKDASFFLQTDTKRELLAPCLYERGLGNKVYDSRKIIKYGWKAADAGLRSQGATGTLLVTDSGRLPF